MCIEIIEINHEMNIELIKEFLFKQIKKEFNYDYIPEYHQDIVNLNDYYISPKRNNFFISIDSKTKQIIGTIGIRGYDKSFEEFENIYSKEKTASVWRLFVDDNYRRCGLATKLFKAVEKFSNENDYEEIYLHTHRNLNGALEFWLKMGFKVTIDTNNELQTIHMEKKLPKIKIKPQITHIDEAIKS
ncbi:GNAT family N-acetyltransferase [Methanobrevibacter oralis]|uniref:Acetyltransferase (GNAT) family protein n=1 Tax=Methanobrevibacter oralis TaxID=66851 RepID=A0A166CDI3_METOA|nr:GNAT family N-acetyltransferase [Methanobrevibacter oralis]KZX13397.1 acetyltransferase (GNAT) family protein [Methanobrevibacter oralis]